MSEDTNGADGQSPFTKKGFIASAIVLFVVVVLGVYLIWSPGDDDEEPQTSEPVQEEEPVEEQPEEDDAEPNGESVCGLPGVAEHGESLTRAPESDGWDYEGNMSYPVSAEYGPAEVEASGYRYCFSQTPEGAIFFAANALDQGEADHASEWIDYAVSEGEHRDSLIQAVGAGAGEEIRLDVVGFRVLSFSPDEAVVHLAVDGQAQGETVQLSAEFYLVWEDGDWKYDGAEEEPLSLVQVGGHGSQVVRWSEGN